MVDRTLPVTEDELHAYVDGELPADRSVAVEQWLASHPDDAARIATWRLQADAIRARFSGTADEAIPSRQKIESLMRSGRNWRAIPAAVAALAFLVGGAVKGGRMIADWPGLKPEQLYEKRDLKPTTDVRAVAKGIVSDLFGLSGPVLAEKVFPGTRSLAPMAGLVA